ncbi:MAG TPA: hypothetical protein VLG10_07705 [Methylomirabilota bacterium]|nr:hypothetical protein [Methylomirabilota bacterium]
MAKDRYTKAVLTVIAVALVVIAVQPWLPSRLLEIARPDPAQAQSTIPKYDLTVPKAWGKFVAFSNNNLLLEAPDNTFRIVDLEGKPPEYPRIKVLFRYQ